VYIAELFEDLPVWSTTSPEYTLVPLELTYAVCWTEFGSENNVSGGGVALEDPPNRLVMSETSPPRPAILLSPPLNTLDNPPEAVCDNKLFHVLPLDDELDVLLLEGLPN
jgi:hypothetical protein